MQNRQPWKRDHKIALASLVVAALALLWSVGNYLIERPSEQLVVFLSDSSKNPKTDIALVGPRGHTVYPDSRGMLLVPRSWAGKNLRVHERSSWREITTIRLLDLGDEPQHQTISQ